MLKRQRPVTPPPSSLGDPPSFLSDGLIRPFQPSHTTDSSQPRSKRQRTRPPPLDGALRGWLESDSAGPHWESDGEEDWIEDTDALRSPLPPSTTVDQYKDANLLLHELHVHNQHRLLFAHSPRDRHLSPSPRAPLPTAHTDTRDPHDRLVSRSCCIESAKKNGLVEEVQCVRQRYEDANRFLGSLFLSRRREVEGMTTCSTGPSPSS